MPKATSLKAVSDITRGAVIRAAHAAKMPIGTYGPAPSDDLEYASWLVECGIDSISLHPAIAVRARIRIAACESSLDFESET